MKILAQYLNEYGEKEKVYIVGFVGEDTAIFIEKAKDNNSFAPSSGMLSSAPFFMLEIIDENYNFQEQAKANVTNRRAVAY